MTSSRYARPLIGEDWVSVPLVNGLQRFARLELIFAEKKCKRVRAARASREKMIHISPPACWRVSFTRQSTKGTLRMANEIVLRYGMNPHQKKARVFVTQGDLPLEVLSGSPGFINILDALNSWALVKELRQALSLPAAASFKHVSPAGAAVAAPMSDTEKKAAFVEDMPDLSPLAVAYARARGADRMSSFGDFAAFSDTVDRTAAELLAREVSDGCIAPGYDANALEILRKKRGGKYVVLAMDPNFQPPELETRLVYGISLEQSRNAAIPGPEL